MSLTPAYELTFFQQIAALVITASLNILKDILVCGLMTEIICQFELMKFDLINLNNGPLESGNNVCIKTFNFI